MKNKIGVQLNSIKTNNKIVSVLKQSQKFHLPYLTIYLTKNSNKSLVEYALLVNKSQFRLATTRNKIKRQLRAILSTGDFKGGIKLLIKPNTLFLKKEFLQIQKSITSIIRKYQNGK